MVRDGDHGVEGATNNFTVAGVLRTSMRVWKQNVVAFSLLALVIYAPALLLRLATPQHADALFLIPFDLVLDTLVAAAVTYGVIMELHGTRPAHRECVRRGLAQVGPALGASLVSALAVVGGLILAAIPGLVVALMLWVVIPVTVAERPGLMASLRRSRELTHGHKWQLLVILLVLWSVGFAATLALDDIVGPRTHAFADLAVNAMLGAFSAVTAAVSYTQLRLVKEGTQLPQIARAFAIVRR